ncbi:MAG: hypothetical protein ACREFQ_20365 [Stellaceae bacterium]
MKGLIVGVMAAAVLAFAAPPASADADSEYADGLPKLIKEMPQGKVPLADGIKAAEAQGKPLSAQYEVDEGHFQLSVFTSKGSDLLEIIVDHQTGAVKNVENLTDPDDIKDAKRQLRATSKASTTLDAAVADAVKQNAGYQAIRVVPKLESGHAVATVMLLKGSDTKTVTEKLD